MQLPLPVERAEIGDRIEVPLDREVTRGYIKAITPSADGFTLDMQTEKGRVDYHVPAGQAIIHVC